MIPPSAHRVPSGDPERRKLGIHFCLLRPLGRKAPNQQQAEGGLPAEARKFAPQIFERRRERCPSGSWCQTRNLVWGNPTGVRIPPSPIRRAHAEPSTGSRQAKRVGLSGREHEQNLKTSFRRRSSRASAPFFYSLLPQPALRSASGNSELHTFPS